MGRRFIGSVVLGLSFVFAGGGALAQNSCPNGQYQTNQKDADLEAYIDQVSAYTRRSFIVDPRIKGKKVTVTSQVCQTSDEIFQVFLSTLRVAGYTAILTNSGAYKVVPAEVAPQRAPQLAEDGVVGDEFVTEVVKLEYFDATAAVSMIKPITDRLGHVAANPRSNALIIADYASNMQRIRQVIAELDKDTSVIETISLKNTSASEMARILGSVNGGGEVRSAPNYSVAVVESSNSIVVRGERTEVDRIRRLTASLDRLGQTAGDISVIYLKYSNAETLLPILAELVGSIRTEEGGVVSTSGETKIAVHAPTNALIINADPETQKALESVIRQLDIRRAQVLIEAIIVEVSDTKARELGLQFILSGTEGSEVPFAASTFSRASPNLLALTGALADLGDLDDDNNTLQNNLGEAAVNSLLGLNGLSLGFGGTNDDGTLFGAILNAVDDDRASNVLSTPSVMTLDNETAFINVGQEIPITTGETLSSDNTNPFRTVQREDVGVQLDVTPQINEGDSIKLFIRQEVSSISGAIISNAADIITDKREIQTTVLVDDGEVIVLGGLIQDTEEVFEAKVPLLGDIPGVGRLFSSKGTSNQKRNLMVFIRPTIVRDRAGARDVSNRKYNYMQADMITRGPDGGARLDKFMSDIVGAPPAQP